jgi:hypothetical protein
VRKGRKSTAESRTERRRKREEKGDSGRKSWCKKKEMGENWSAHKVWGKIIKRD